MADDRHHLEPHAEPPAGLAAQAEPQPECRLCLDAEYDAAEGEDGRLVYPCLCAAPVHVACLRRWQAAKQEQALEERRTADEARARAATCEVCNAQLVLDGERAKPFSGTAICRAHGGFGKVALRRVPTMSRAHRNFSDSAVSEGQQVEVLEQDITGEFFRIRASKAPRYREEGTVAVAEGWIRSAYLEWPSESQHLASAAVPEPRRPPAYVEYAAAVAAATAAAAVSTDHLAAEGAEAREGAEGEREEADVAQDEGEESEGSGEESDEEEDV